MLTPSFYGPGTRPSRIGPDFSISCQGGEDCISKGPKTIRPQITPPSKQWGSQRALDQSGRGTGTGTGKGWPLTFLLRPSPPPLSHTHPLSNEKTRLDLGRVNDSQHQFLPTFLSLSGSKWKRPKPDRHPGL